MKWALLDEHVFNELLSEITNLLTELERLIPETKSIQVKLAAEDFQRLGAEVGDRICEMLANQDRRLVTAIDEMKAIAASSRPGEAQGGNNTTYTFSVPNNYGFLAGTASFSGGYHNGSSN